MPLARPTPPRAPARATARLLPALVLLAATALPATVSAVPVFDFEGVTQGLKGPSFSITSDGVTLTVSVETFPATGNVSVVSSGVPAIGLGVIGTAPNAGFEPLRFAFDTPLDSITFGFGDQGGDDDSPVLIQAFSATDLLLGTVTDSHDETVTEGKTRTVDLAGASYYVVSSAAGGGNPDSLIWEVTSLTLAQALAEPVTSGVLAAGLLGALIGRRRRPSR